MVQLFHVDAEQEGTERFHFYNHVCSWIKAIFVDTNAEKMCLYIRRKNKRIKEKRGKML